MNAPPNLDLLLDPAFRDLRSAVLAAFDIGRKWGRAEAAEEMKARLTAALNLDGSQTSEVAVSSDKAEIPVDKTNEEIDSNNRNTSTRAPRGSIRPAILRLLGSVAGVTQIEIVEETRINENSVRGMLNSLRNEGLVERQGDVWSLTIMGDRQVDQFSKPSTGDKNTEADEMDTGKVPSAASATVDLD